MPLSGTLKERLAQYKQLKEEEEQRLRREAAARMLEDDKDEEEDEFGTSFANDDDDDEAEYEEEEYYEDEEENEDGDIDEERGGGNVFDVLEEGSTTSPGAATSDAAGVEQDEQEVFLALDEAERAEQYHGEERVGGAAAGVGITHVYTTHNNNDAVEEGAARTISFPSGTLANTNGTVRSGAAAAAGGGTGALTTERRSTTSVAKSSRSHGRTPEAKHKTYLLLGVVLVGCLAIVAIVLPFVFDYGRTNNKIQILTPPGPTPTPATTVAPTVVPAGNETEAEEEDEEELLLQPANNWTESPTVTPTTVQWGQFLTTFLIPVSGEAVFADETSPQYRAAEYILTDPYTTQLTTTEQLEDRYASLTLYYATDGANWTTCYLGDTTTCPEGRQWLVDDTCTWYGITCNEEGRVTAYQFGTKESFTCQQIIMTTCPTFASCFSYIFFSYDFIFFIIIIFSRLLCYPSFPTSAILFSP